MDLGQIGDFIQKAGVVGLLAFAIVGGYKGWYVFGWQYRAKEDECDDWKRIALRGMDLAETSVTTLSPNDANQAQRVVRQSRG